MARRWRRCPWGGPGLYLEPLHFHGEIKVKTWSDARVSLSRYCQWRGRFDFAHAISPSARWRGRLVNGARVLEYDLCVGELPPPLPILVVDGHRVGLGGLELRDGVLRAPGCWAMEQLLRPVEDPKCAAVRDIASRICWRGIFRRLRVDAYGEDISVRMPLPDIDDERLETYVVSESRVSDYPRTYTAKQVFLGAICGLLHHEIHECARDADGGFVLGDPHQSGAPLES